jgi:hypothetical protein
MNTKINTIKTVSRIIENILQSDPQYKANYWFWVIDKARNVLNSLIKEENGDDFFVLTEATEILTDELDNDLTSPEDVYFVLGNTKNHDAIDDFNLWDDYKDSTSALHDIAYWALYRDIVDAIEVYSQLEGDSN